LGVSDTQAGNLAVDLGAGFGTHSIPLAHNGWRVLRPARTDDQSYLDSVRQAAFAPVFASFHSIPGVSEVTDKVVGFVSIQLNHEMHVGEVWPSAVRLVHAGHDMGTAMYAFAQYHDYANLPLMVLPSIALQRVEKTMNNTIDDADHIINLILFVLIIQLVKNSCHSHSIVNEPFFHIAFNGLYFG